MLEKTMKSIIQKKVKDWVSTIDCDDVKKAIKKDLIITGGCFTSMILNETINDFDCYFRTKESLLKVVNYYVDKWNEHKGLQTNKIGCVTKVMVLDGDNPSEEILNYYNITNVKDSDSRMISNIQPGRVKIIFPSDGVTGDPEQANNNEELGVESTNELIEEDIDLNQVVEELDEIDSKEAINKEKKKYFPAFFSSNAITLSNDIQIVARFYGEPGEIHDTYDYEHTKAYYDVGKKELVIPQRVYELTINKTLFYTGSKYPICSAFRMRKFIERGWSINAGQILKMAMQISELNLMDIVVLEDQLIGVDSLYFMNLIDQFRKQKEKSPDFELTPDYIVSIIDKIF